MKIYSLIFSLIAALGLTSCLGESEGTVITQDFSPYIFTYSTDLTTGTSLANTGARYSLSTNTDKGTCSLNIQNLKLADGSYISLEIPDQSYSFSTTGAMTVKLPVVLSTYNGTVHTLTNYNFEYYARYLNNQAFPIIVSSFTVDDKDEVRIVYNPAYYWGTTTVTDDSGNTYVNEAQTAFYGIQFDTDKKEAMVAAFNIQFADKMPALTMTFKNLPYILTQTHYTVSASELTPYIGETPYPDYKITNFSMTGNWDGSQTISFKCTIDTEKVKGSYDVRATLSILPKFDQNQ